MSTTGNSEQIAEQRSSTSDESGCKLQADQNIPIMAHAGFVELRRRAKQKQNDVITEQIPAEDMDVRIPIAFALHKTCDEFIAWIDELSGCEEHKQGGS